MRLSSAVTRPTFGSRVLALVAGILTLAALVTGFTAVAAPALTSTPSTFTAIQPTRFLDTRGGVGPTGTVGARATVTASAASLVPSNATAVVMNLWAEGPTADSAVTVFPHGYDRPSLPNLLLQPNKRRANMVTVQVNADRTFDLYNEAGSTHLIASVLGYYSTGAGSLYTPLSPDRLPIYHMGPNSTTQLNLTGSVPATATAAVFSLTLTQPTESTYVTAFPHGNSRPMMANVAANLPGQGSNLITVKIGSSRSVDLYNLAGTVQVNAVLVGFYASDFGALFTPVSPARVLDSRTGLGTFNGQPGKIGPHSDLSYRLQSPIPTTAIAATLNLTGYAPTEATSITAWDNMREGDPDPSLNLSPGQTVSVATIPTVTSIYVSATDEEVLRTTYIHNRAGSIDVTFDISGYFTLPPGSCQTGCVSMWGNKSWPYGTEHVAIPRLIPGLNDIVAIAGNAYAGYALRPDGTVRAWGYNSVGELGNGWWSSVAGASHAPVPVVGLTSVTAITGSFTEAFALRSDGTVWRWGHDSNAPAQVPGLTGVTAIAAGTSVANAFVTSTLFTLKTDGTVWAWGGNSSGQLGNGSTVARSDTPVRVSGLSGVKAIGGSPGSNGYAVKADGTVWAWGDNGYSQLGNGATCATPGQCLSRVPVQVSGLTGITAVAGDGGRAFALRNDGVVFAWGDNHSGGLGNGLDCESGNGPNCSSPVPVQVRDITDAKTIASAGGGGYAIRADNTLWGWGDNYNLSLGKGVVSYPNFTSVPVRIPGVSGVKSVVSGLALSQ